MTKKESESLKEFFFKAMLAGWAGEGKKSKIAELPGYKYVVFREDDLMLTDIYSVTSNSSKSSGLTTIFYNNNPVWVMHYWGWYYKKAILIVKEALTQAYSKGIFWGGRGLEALNGNSMDYRNWPDENSFDCFSGREFVRLEGDEHSILGYHEYKGGSLI